MNKFIAIATTLVMATMITSPALAGRIIPTPAPIAGIGFGAFALLGVGYRALKARSKK